jgi:hypothetical protein
MHSCHSCTGHKTPTNNYVYLHATCRAMVQVASHAPTKQSLKKAQVTQITLIGLDEE